MSEFECHKCHPCDSCELNGDESCYMELCEPCEMVDEGGEEIPKCCHLHTRLIIQSQGVPA